jgi:hypothetical protein
MKGNSLQEFRERSENRMHRQPTMGPRKAVRLCGERRSKGANAVFAVRRKRR